VLIYLFTGGPALFLLGVSPRSLKGNFIQFGGEKKLLEVKNFITTPVRYSWGVYISPNKRRGGFNIGPKIFINKSRGKEIPGGASENPLQKEGIKRLGE